MSLDLDTRARRAAENLKALVDAAPLATPARRRPARRWRATAGAVLVVAASTAAAAVVLDTIPSPDALPVQTAPTTPTTTSATVPTTTAVTGLPATVDATPPALAITYPADGAVLADKVVTFRGTTEPGAAVFAGPYQAEVGPDGSWSLVLVLSEGSNRVRFQAWDAAGNRAAAEVTVVWAPPTTTTSSPSTTTKAPTTTTKTQPADFAAFATFGECSESPPYDIYYGVGEPGTKVSVKSKYGGGSAEVGADGKWEVTVFFPDAPLGEPILVTVADEFGRQKTFEFTALG